MKGKLRAFFEEQRELEADFEHQFRMDGHAHQRQLRDWDRRLKEWQEHDGCAKKLKETT